MHTINLPLKGILLSSVLLLLVGCAEPLPEQYRDYAGEWHGNNMYLHITPSGRVMYEREKDNGHVSVDGPITEFNDEGFEVGVLFITTQFEVTQPPQQLENGQWSMIVDGVKLTRYKK